MLNSRIPECFGLEGSTNTTSAIAGLSRGPCHIFWNKNQVEHPQTHSWTSHIPFQLLFMGLQPSMHSLFPSTSSRKSSGAPSTIRACLIPGFWELGEHHLYKKKQELEEASAARKILLSGLGFVRMKMCLENYFNISLSVFYYSLKN